MKSRRSILKGSRQKRVQKQKRRYLAVFATILFVVFLLIGLFVWVSGLERFLIKDVNIDGNSLVQTENVLNVIDEESSGKYLYLFTKKNTFIYPKGTIENKLLEEFKRIKSIDLKREDFTTVKVYITEHKPKHLWCSENIVNDDTRINESCYFMNKDGFVYAKAPSFSGNIFFEWYTKSKDSKPIGNFILDENIFNKLITLIDVIGSFGFDLIQVVEQEEGDFALISDNGNKILFNIDQDSSELVDTLDSVLDEIPDYNMLEYIDLRFGNKVFYRSLE